MTGRPASNVLRQAMASAAPLAALRTSGQSRATPRRMTGCCASISASNGIASGATPFISRVVCAPLAIGAAAVPAVLELDQPADVAERGGGEEGRAEEALAVEP